jgi:anti-sigma-K factor RskA
MTHSEMQELIPVYALDALPDDEDMELRIHVENCSECALLLKDHLETAGALAASVQPMAPSPALKGRIFEQIRASAPAVISSPRRTGLLGRWLPATAVAALVAVAGLSAVLARRVETQNAELQEQRRVLALAGAPAVRALPLKATGDAGRASGKVFVDPEGKFSGMVVTGLREPREGVYALWLIQDGKPRLVENFSPDRSGAAVILVPEEVGEERTVAVTLEPRPDTSAPQGPVLLSA